MIEKMKKACLVCKLSEKSQMLSSLRDFGLMHLRLDGAEASGGALDALAARLAALQRTRGALEERRDRKRPLPPAEAGPAEFEAADKKVQASLARLAAVGEELAKRRLRLSEVQVWGDWDERDCRFVRSRGVQLRFYILSKKDIARIPEDVSYMVLSPVAGRPAVAVVGGALPEGLGAEFDPAVCSPSSLRKEIEEGEAEAAALERSLHEASALVGSYDREIRAVAERIRFEMARGAAKAEGGALCWIEGFVPESALYGFRRFAAANGYAFALDDVTEEDNPPTKMVYNKVTGLIKPLFDMLGTIPGYFEYDISLWFLMFFALFFAMIIGDAAYGLLFVVLAVILHKRKGKADNLVMLVYVLGVATTVWGALTGTWFGSEAIIRNCRLLQLVTVKELANFPAVFGVEERTVQDTVMRFCFILGTIQLSLACVITVVRKVRERNISAVADVGWLVMIDALYLLVLLLVLNKPVNGGVVVGAVALGFVLVVAFGAQGPGVSFGKGLAAGAGGLFTTFLDTISAFGNIMSYIRLFAVGMASVEIAKSFNSMASGMLRGWALPAGALVLVVGHSLNLVMGLLSVVVHGVRLNLLEFSGQLGMTWTGTAYEPFCKSRSEE